MAFSLTRFLIKHPAGKLTNNSHSHLPAVVLFLYIPFCNQYSITTEVSFHVSQNGLATKWMNKYKEKILIIQCKNSHMKSIIARIYWLICIVYITVESALRLYMSFANKTRSITNAQPVGVELYLLSYALAHFGEEFSCPLQAAR